MKSEIFSQIYIKQSRRDDTLLTVDFNLRTEKSLHSPQSPAGTILLRNKEVSSLRDLGDALFCAFRRLKSTVNKVSSLRDCFTERSGISNITTK